MKVLVFKTQLKSRKRVRAISALFDGHPKVNHWSVDTEDCDHVLRIEAPDTLRHHEISCLMNACGYYCEAL